MRAAEVALLATLPPGTLMQRAATGLADACVDFIGGAYGKRVLLVVGGGDNGGDALFAGALLARRGARVDVLLVGDRAHPAGLAALLTAGGRVTGSVSPADLAVDAIVGIGGRPGLSDQAYAVIRDLRQRQIPVLAVDVPSGVDVDGATLPARHVTADVTITFGTHKLALLAGPAAEAAGVVHLVDIGLGDLLGPAVATTTSAADLRRHAALLVPGPHDHKYTRGVVGVAAGSADYTGAGLLCVAGASCGLAGMVRYCGDDEVVRLVRAAHPEVVIGQGRVQAWGVGSCGGGGADRVLRGALAHHHLRVARANQPHHLVFTAVAHHAGEPARGTGHAEQPGAGVVR
ncbi:MAG: NAD(P)H-hydrate epimerase, partial [Nocardioidaceae bacterium]